ncbi:SDR family oxidoreductase (plasmid) [Streptomyces sp. NBC_01456]|uniref:SDR family oxidoreductase n=1 Tax=unclassified Streptomyces TaxID=2593676 RepID=UPI002E2FE1F0|nr:MULTISPECIES: SDR family oxidoreductase [unclassified Streptomyces]
MQAELTGTAALVTGASSGIGRATAHRLARLGATVALLARRAEALEQVCCEIRSAGGEAFAVCADLADAAGAEQAVAQVVDTAGRLDILINCAGAAHLSSFADAVPSRWQSMIDINLSGTLNIAHAALSHLVDAAASSDRRTADLVTVGSTAGRQGSPGTSVYAATKQAVAAWSEGLRRELAPSGVRVGLIQPGLVDTPLARSLGGSPGQGLNAEDVADAVAYVVTRPAGVAVAELVVRAAGR